jgi:hypothetical protein
MTVTFKKSNWLSGTLSGPKRPIFCLRHDHANQLQKNTANKKSLPCTCFIGPTEAKIIYFYSR